MYVVTYGIDFRKHEYVCATDEEVFMFYWWIIHSRQAREGEFYVKDTQGARYTLQHGIPLRSLHDKVERSAWVIHVPKGGKTQ